MSKPEVASATHVIYSYRIRQSDGSVWENFDSDVEYGMGLNLLKRMQSTNCLLKKKKLPSWLRPSGVTSL